MYIPDPTDVTQPTDDKIAETATAEFRALKAYIQTLIGNLAYSNAFRKNLIINGAHQLDQRNEGAAVVLTAGGKYITDKWYVNRNSTSTSSAQQVATPFPLSAFALKYGTTVAGVPAAADTALLRTAIEGRDAAYLEWGTVNAAPVSLSFLIESPVAGLHSFALRNSALNRTYVDIFLVNAVNTPQQITINNIPGDLAGTWLGTNGIGIEVDFDMGSGANLETAATAAWQAGAFTRTAGCVQVSNHVGNLLITNVQLEASSACSPFEQSKWQDVLQWCQRYYWKTFNQGVAPAVNIGATDCITFQQTALAGNILRPVRYPVPMRATPTVTPFTPFLAGATDRAYDTTAGALSGAIDTTSTIGTKGLTAVANVAGGSAIGDVYWMHLTATADHF